MIIFIPFVEEIDRTGWEAYSNANQWWFEQDYVSGLLPEDDSSAAGVFSLMYFLGGRLLLPILLVEGLPGLERFFD